ncbi:54S ribosomal protein L24, mitochondrial [Lactarius tabidus]
MDGLSMRRDRPGALVTRDGQCVSCSRRSQASYSNTVEKKHPFAPPFRLPSSLDLWLPNIQTKRLFSDALGEKYGGLDHFVLRAKADLLGWEGMRLRVAVREAQERNALEASSSPSEAPTLASAPA